MIFNKETIQKILGIAEKTYIKPEEMADKLNITFYPYDETKQSANVLKFRQKLEQAFIDLKVNIVPFEESLHTIPLYKSIIRALKILLNNLLFYIDKVLYRDSGRFLINAGVLKNTFKRTRIKKGISVVATGDYEGGQLPIDITSSFTETSIVTISDAPNDVDENSSFSKHFDTAMSFFSKQMTNIAIAIKGDKWILYNFNASHPTYDINGDIKNEVLHALIPKIYAPIRPHKFTEFVIKKDGFDINDDFHKKAVADMVESGAVLEKTNLYPKGKSLDDLPFRNKYYRWIGKIHLDNRNGMSYGFLARVLPTKLETPIPVDQFPRKVELNPDGYFMDNGDLYVSVDAKGQNFYLKVPEVWVVSQRSGCDKTNINPNKDLLKLGLKNGQMYVQAPKGLKITGGYRPSFDTKVILAHAVGSAIVASVLKYMNPESLYAKKISEEGIAICHWHGYINPSYYPDNYLIYGLNNPHVACFTPQAALYALDGKLNSFLKDLDLADTYTGDIHIEPHHGTNICFSSLNDFGNFILSSPEISSLGNKYLGI